MKTGVEALRGIRYKLRMMGVPLTGPTYVYGNNMSVIYNTSQLESTLNKKRNSICYHAVRKALASDECLTTHCKTGDNYSDMMNCKCQTYCSHIHSYDTSDLEVS